MMTKGQLARNLLAKSLDGRKYLQETTDEEERMAKKTGLVIVFGAGDDYVKFRGAIYKNLDVTKDKLIPLDKHGVAENFCDDEACKTIEAIWRPPSGGSWAYKTDIPHATFKIIEEDKLYHIGSEKLYCTGIVFEMAALADVGRGVCQYRQESDDSCWWQCTECHVKWLMEDGDPLDCEMNYCPKCGRHVEAIIEICCCKEVGDYEVLITREEWEARRKCS